MKPTNKSDEFFVEQLDGSRTDAELHEPILAGGDLEKAFAASRRIMREIGLSEAEIDRLLGKS